MGEVRMEGKPEGGNVGAIVVGALVELGEAEGARVEGGAVVGGRVPKKHTVVRPFE